MQLLINFLIFVLVSQTAYSATLDHDHENRLIEFDDGSARTQYIYDALGRRIKSIVDADSTNPQTTRFLYSGGHVLEERDGQDTMRKRYLCRRSVRNQLQFHPVKIGARSVRLFKFE